MKVMITCYGGGHVNMCIPVIKKLQELGHNVFVLALTVAGPVLERHGIAHERPLDYVDFETVAPWGRMLLARHHTDGKGLTEAESLAYLGVSLENLVRDIGEKAALAAYGERGLNAFCPTDFMMKVIKAEKPDVVVATTSPRMEKAAMRAAHQLGVPSICMIDLFAIIEFDWLKRPDNGQFLTLPNEKLRDRFIAAGRDPDGLIVTGNPGFDTLAAYKNLETRTDYGRRKNIPPDARIILFAEQPEPEDPELPRRVRQHLSEVCRHNPGWQLVVRLHPASTDPKGEVIPEGVCQSHADENLHEAIRAADAVITLTSTVGMEALLLDVPTLILGISPFQKYADYSERDGALVVDDLSKAEEALNTLLSQNETATSLSAARKRLPSIGGATERVIALMERIVQG